MDIKDTFIYRSHDVATYIAALANEQRIGINMTKVQKLLYIIYGVYLIGYDERLLNEHPQAWPFGPVFPTTRNKLLKKDISSITMEDIPEDERHKIAEDANLNKIIDFVFESFGYWNDGQLSAWSHSAGSPWEQATNRKGFKWGDTISDYSIRDYFNGIISIKKKNDTVQY